MSAGRNAIRKRMGEVVRRPDGGDRYPKRVRLLYGTYGVHRGAPCLWGSKAEALENCDVDERVYAFRVEMVREVKP